RAAGRAGARVPPRDSSEPSSARPLLLLLLLQLLEELVLGRFVFLEGERAQLELPLGLRETAAYRRLLAQLALGLRRELLGDPDRAANRSKRKRQQTREKTHQAAPDVPTETKLCGASGPTYL